MINNIAILFFASVVIIGCDSKTKLKEDGNENNVVSNLSYYKNGNIKVKGLGF